MGASYSITETQWSAIGTQGGQSLNYRDPVVGATSWVSVME